MNLIDNSMEKRLGLCYTTILINCHHQTHGDNEVYRSTVNLAFGIIQPKHFIVTMCLMMAINKESRIAKTKTFSHGIINHIYFFFFYRLRQRSEERRGR